MVTFIDGNRMEYGVELICRVLPIAPSTYYAHKVVQANPERRSNRSKRDEYLTEEIKRVWVDNYSVYGSYAQMLCMEGLGGDPVWCDSIGEFDSFFYKLQQVGRI